MAVNVTITPGSGATVGTDEVVDATLGTVKVQYVKIMDGTLAGTSKATVGANGLKTDGSGVTQPVSAAALPLPTGAATAAKQPALGVAGTPSADVISVQGVTSMTALKVDGSGVTQPVSGTVTTNPVMAANTTGGTSTFFASAQLATVTAVKTTAGNLYGFTLQNPNAAAAYLQLFDLAVAGVTLGTTAPKLSYWIPGNGAYDFAFTDETKVSFAAAITLAVTTTATGLTAPALGVLTNLLFK